MEPKIKVGILYSQTINFTLNGRFKHLETGKEYEGEGVVTLQNSLFQLNINGEEIKSSLPLILEPVAYDTASFVLQKVVIGIDFHWERSEDQTFKGALQIIEENKELTAINILKLEDYLTSVISSEMSATSSAELLKAHAVISRSWLLAQIQKEKELKDKAPYTTFHESTDAYIKWYDREDHKNFDVCADDHCQRYQGVTRASTAAVNSAIADTYGQVLTYEHKICDARFSKCCGGVTELFENVWEPIPHPYLTKVIDESFTPQGYEMDLKIETHAEKWIKSSPNAYCNTSDKDILTQVLNDYDLETADFYRWKITYTQAEVQQLLKKKIGLDLGEVIDLIPIERGESSRLIKLKIKGTKGAKTIGKELEIRKALSDSHLYSSAFTVEKGEIVNGIPLSFKLIGAGWGHGVGLCQIGAAVMGAKGFTYKEILKHYFGNAGLENIY